MAKTKTKTETKTKTVLVTGCGNPTGAGAALAREFRARGHRVFATYRQPPGGAHDPDVSPHPSSSTSSSTSTTPGCLDFLAELGIEPLALDVCSPASVAAATRAVRERTAKVLHDVGTSGSDARGDSDQNGDDDDDNGDAGGGEGGGCLDILINNAAAFSMSPLADADLDEARRMFDANVFGALSVTQAFLPLLMKAGGSGLVVNIGSISAGLCPPFQGVYAASKAALAALGHTMRVEFAPLGVRVVTVVSGGVDTRSGTNGKQRTQQPRIPEGSLYYKVLSDDDDNDNDGKNKGYTGMDAAEYARQVVDDLLQENPKPLIWRGAFAWVAWGLSWAGWTGMMDRGQITRNGLDKIIIPSN
ncbi:hypothetical protein BX600DRAFT_516269 [Xylariales sp. PMI_506]|nr:hypothetical protein BX600DRAFT_516269 [Xylariales sp. PMI_506]